MPGAASTPGKQHDMDALAAVRQVLTRETITNFLREMSQPGASNWNMIPYLMTYLAVSMTSDPGDTRQRAAIEGQLVSFYQKLIRYNLGHPLDVFAYTLGLLRHTLGVRGCSRIASAQILGFVCAATMISSAIMNERIFSPEDWAFLAGLDAALGGQGAPPDTRQEPPRGPEEGVLYFRGAPAGTDAAPRPEAAPLGGNGRADWDRPEGAAAGPAPDPGPAVVDTLLCYHRQLLIEHNDWDVLLSAKEQAQSFATVKSARMLFQAVFRGVAGGSQAAYAAEKSGAPASNPRPGGEQAQSGAPGQRPGVFGRPAGLAAPLLPVYRLAPQRPGKAAPRASDARMCARHRGPAGLWPRAFQPAADRQNSASSQGVEACQRPARDGRPPTPPSGARGPGVLLGGPFCGPGREVPCAGWGAEVGA